MTRTPRRRPSLERLEDRRLPATFGLAWPDPQHLTLSFAPDGTNVANAPSVLSRTLDARLPDASWKVDILRAFQAWADLGNINIGLVTDNGQAPGQPGPLQGNPGFGDLRISAQPLPSNVLAEAVPFDLLDNWSGDVVFNSGAVFGEGPQAPADLYTVALHEVGHVFGFDDNPADPASVMYPTYKGPREGPSPADAAALQALYGVRQPDPYEGPLGNDTFATATPLTGLHPSTLAGGSAARADVSSLTDKDVYAFNASPDSTGPLAVVVRASGISLLTARVTVYDAQGHAIASATASDPLHNDVTVTLPSAAPGARYYAKVESASADVFGIGAYTIAAGTPVLARLAVFPPLSSAGLFTDGGRNHSFDQATSLKPTTPGTDAGWQYVTRDGLANPAETDFFSVQSPSTPPGVLVVTVWGLQPHGLAPRLDVFDAQHHRLAVQILASDADSYTVQVPAASAGTRYVVEVSAAHPRGPQAVGGYVLAMDFRSTPISLSPFTSGTLAASSSQNVHTLTVAATELVHFDLSLSGGAQGARGGSTVRMIVLDAKGNVVSSLRAHGGAGSAVGDVVLRPGKYTVRFVAATRTGTPLPRSSYVLRGTVRSDALGPEPVDPTLLPVPPVTTNPPLLGPGPWIILHDPTQTPFLNLTDPLGIPVWT